MQYNISYWCVSNIGKIRHINQDNYICDNRYLETTEPNLSFPLCGVKSSQNTSLFGVFDGMGGEECGEIAAYIAAKNAATLEIGKDPLDDLLQFCKKANTDICEYASMNDISAMGTTAAMLAFTSSGVTLCNIGDSKIFRFCDGALEQISRDDVAAAAFGTKPPLSQNLGIPPNELVIDPYLAQGPYNVGDLYLICSDGLTDMVTTDEMARIMTSVPTEETTTALLNKALSNGGRDNVTIILCKIERKSGWFFNWIHRNLRKRYENGK